MPEVDKREVVLSFMAGVDIPLRPMGIYGGLIYRQDITFSYRTVQNIVSELADEGLIARVEIDTDAGEVRRLAPDAGDRRAYYVVTDAGHGHVRE